MDECGVCEDLLTVTQRWLSIRRVKASSLKRYRQQIRAMLAAIGNVSLRELSIRHGEKWLIQRGNSLAPAGYAAERVIIISLLQYAAQFGAPVVPWREVLPKRKVPRRIRFKMPSREEFIRIIGNMQFDEVRRDAGDFVQLLAYSGMRLTEAANLRWCDVDWQRGTFLVTGGKHGTKNGENRNVPLFDDMRALLERLINRRVSVKVNATDRLMKNNSPRSALRGACKRLGLPQFNQHSLRHFFATNAIERGVDFRTLSQWLGHTDGGYLVFRTYGHLRAEHSTRMARQVSINPPVPAHPFRAEVPPLTFGFLPECHEPW